MIYKWYIYITDILTLHLINTVHVFLTSMMAAGTGMILTLDPAAVMVSVLSLSPTLTTYIGAQKGQAAALNRGQRSGCQAWYWLANRPAGQSSVRWRSGLGPGGRPGWGCGHRGLFTREKNTGVPRWAPAMWECAEWEDAALLEQLGGIWEREPGTLGICGYVGECHVYPTQTHT